MSNDDWRPPTEDEIRERAYELYLERTRYGGGALDDWLEAEADLWMKRAIAGVTAPTDAPKETI